MGSGVILLMYLFLLRKRRGRRIIATLPASLCFQTPSPPPPASALLLLYVTRPRLHIVGSTHKENDPTVCLRFFPLSFSLSLSLSLSFSCSVVNTRNTPIMHSLAKHAPDPPPHFLPPLIHATLTPPPAGQVLYGITRLRVLPGPPRRALSSTLELLLL